MLSLAVEKELTLKYETNIYFTILFPKNYECDSNKNTVTHFVLNI